MKKYLGFLKYAIKEQRQYRVNFFASMATMIFNDICFVIIFIIFLGYFSSTGLTLGNFLVLISLSCLGYGIIHGLFSNIGALSDVIEQGKLDYYLSFPIKPLYFLASTKIRIGDVGDIIFGFICLLIYAFAFADAPASIVIIKGIGVLILSSLAMIGLYILIGSISFRLQRGSKIADLFNSTFVSFSEYPPEIYNQNRLVYIFMCMILLPSIILPYQIMMNESTLLEWIVLIGLCIICLVLGIWVFNRGLKRYSSGNLVHQM